MRGPINAGNGCVESADGVMVRAVVHEGFEMGGFVLQSVAVVPVANFAIVSEGFFVDGKSGRRHDSCSFSFWDGLRMLC